MTRFKQLSYRFRVRKKEKVESEPVYSGRNRIKGIGRGSSSYSSEKTSSGLEKELS